VSSRASAQDPARQLLRHTVATVAYRGGKTLRGAPANFPTFRCGETTRTPGDILAHMGDLFAWALCTAQGKQEWKPSKPQEWNADVERFFAAVQKFDDYLASSEPLHAPPQKLFQGPIADALNHVGQIALLRRMAGAPIRGENYFVAEIVAGCCGPDQPSPRREFD
jgi:hypothetical protein